MTNPCARLPRACSRRHDGPAGADVDAADQRVRGTARHADPGRRGRWLGPHEHPLRPRRRRDGVRRDDLAVDTFMADALQRIKNRTADL